MLTEICKGNALHTDAHGGVQSPCNRFIVSITWPVEILAVDPGEKMFVQSMKFIETHSGRNDNVSIFGQKSNPDT